MHVADLFVDVIPRLSLPDFKRQLAEASRETIDIKVKVDTVAARAEIAKAAKDATANVRVNANATKANAEIDRAARDRRANIKVDVQGQKGVNFAFKGLSTLVTAIVGLGPAVLPAVSAVAAGVGVLGSAFATAGAAGGAFGLALKGQQQAFKDHQKATKTLGAQITKYQGQVAAAKAGLASATTGTSNHAVANVRLTIASQKVAAAQAGVAAASTKSAAAQAAARKRLVAAEQSYALVQASTSASAAKGSARQTAAQQKLAGAQKNLTSAQKALATENATFTKAFGPTETGLTRLKDAFKNYTLATAPQTSKTAGNALTLAANILPRLVPLGNAAAKAVGGLVGDLARFSKTAEFQNILNFFVKYGPQAITSFGHIAGHIVLGVFNVFKSFAPYQQGLLTWIEGMSKKFQDWSSTVAGSGGFAKWMKSVQDNLPAIKQLVVDLTGVIAKFVGGLSPLSKIEFVGIANLVGLLNKMSPQAFAVVATGISGIVLGLKAWELGTKAVNIVTSIGTGVIAAWNFATKLAEGAALGTRIQLGLLAVQTFAVSAAQKVAAVATTIWAGAQRVLNLVMSANPIAKVIAVISLLVAGAIYAYTHFKTLHNIVNAAWAGIKTAAVVAWSFIQPIFAAIGRWIVGSLIPFFGRLWNYAKVVFAGIGQAIVVAWNVLIKPIFLAYKFYILNIIIPALKILWDIAKAVFNGLGTAIRFAWTKVILPTFTALKAGVNAVKGTFTAVVGAIGTIWNGIKAKLSGPVKWVVDNVINPLIRAIDLIPGINIKTINSAAIGAAPVNKAPTLVGRTTSGHPAVLNAATGGPVPINLGERGKDSVPAMLTPGEHVWTEAEVRKVGGQRNMLRLRKLIAEGRLGVADLGAIQGFATGGTIPDSRIAAAQDFARAQVGKPYLWGGVGPYGYDCSGFMSAITNVIQSRNPYSRRGSTADFPWGGFANGSGQFTIGSINNFGGSGVGHMAGTLGGLGVESYGHHGPAINHRNAYSAGFATHAHLGSDVYVGAPGGGGGGGGGGGFDWLGTIKNIVGDVKKVVGVVRHLTGAALGGTGNFASAIAKGIGNKVIGFVNDKIPNSFGPINLPDNPIPHFRSGGRVRGRGTGTSDSITARLSNGEYIVPAAAADTYGPLLEFMSGNQGYAAGGRVHATETRSLRGFYTAVKAAFDGTKMAATLTAFAKKYLTGATEKATLAHIQRLVVLQGKLAALGAAQTQLAALRSQRAQTVTDVGGTIAPALADYSSQPGGIAAGLHAKVAQVGKYVAAIRNLKAAGYPIALVRQVAALGLTDGVNAANQLLDPALSKSTKAQLIKDFNSLTTASGEGGSAGIVGNLLWGDQINGQARLVNQLNNSVAVHAAMEKLGQSIVIGMAKALHVILVPTAAKGKAKATHDAGGWLGVGRTLAVNNTGKPEAVLTSGQWQQMDRLISAVERGQGGTGAPLIGHADIHSTVDLDKYERQRAFRDRATRV